MPVPHRILSPALANIEFHLGSYSFFHTLIVIQYYRLVTTTAVYIQPAPIPYRGIEYVFKCAGANDAVHSSHQSPMYSINSSGTRKP